METIIGKTYKNVTVHIDYSHYQKCSFINCVIHISSGIFALEGCDFANCSLSMSGPARNIATIIQMFFKDKPVKLIKGVDKTVKTA